MRPCFRTLHTLQVADKEIPSSVLLILLKLFTVSTWDARFKFEILTQSRNLIELENVSYFSKFMSITFQVSDVSFKNKIKIS